MNILLIGAGGREHALAWKLAQSPHCTKVYVAPGNAGTAQIATNLPIGISDFDAIGRACVSHSIKLVIVGPEEPLVKGIVDFFSANTALQHIQMIGPNKKAAQMEGSKSFAKAFMNRHHIPTAVYKKFDSNNYAEGLTYIQQHSLPVVLKADGLAAGKGVLICHNHIEALAEYELMIQQNKFGAAGNTLIVEAFLTGIEMSVFALTDGEHYVMLPEAKDYKKVGEGDTGLNTGGMGAISPVPFLTEELQYKIRTQIVIPTIDGLKQDDIDYKGVLFIGLIIEDGSPKVIEYNCRFGDPETEVVIPRVKNDLIELFNALHNKRLHEVSIEVNPQTAAAVVAVSGGYPGSYIKQQPIAGLNDLPASESLIFHAGTALASDGTVETNGGRVLVATSFGKDIKEAVQKSTEALSHISFEGMNFRTDIGYEFY